MEEKTLSGHHEIFHIPSEPQMSNLRGRFKIHSSDVLFWGGKANT